MRKFDSCRGHQQFPANRTILGDGRLLPETLNDALGRGSQGQNKGSGATQMKRTCGLKQPGGEPNQFGTAALQPGDKHSSRKAGDEEGVAAVSLAVELRLFGAEPARA